jgi:hypothetical protein
MCSKEEEEQLAHHFFLAGYARRLWGKYSTSSTSSELAASVSFAS